MPALRPPDPRSWLSCLHLSTCLGSQASSEVVPEQLSSRQR